MKRNNVLVASMLLLASFTQAQQVKWKYSTNEERWKNGTEVRISPVANEEADVNITKNKDQVIDGFGACFNELGWDALSLLAPKDKNAILQELFHPQKGVCFTYCRTTIGANDYSRDWYSLNEQDKDFEMKNFNIERDKKAMIPYIKAALAINPKLKVWGSPWSPPTWMKTNKHYATQSGSHNDLKKENQVLEGDHFIQEKPYLDAFALYLSKYVDAYKKENINICEIQFQNEPYTRNQWPTCLWTPPAMRNFIANHLGPLFSKKHPHVDLWFGTINCNKMEDVETVMSDPKARKYIKGIGLQWEGKHISANIHQKYPDIKLMQTENECGGGTFDWPAAEYTFDLIKKYIDGGCNSYMYWNMILKDKGTSTWGWHQNAMIVVDSQTKKVNFTPEFYLIKHFSHYVKPGAYKIQTTGYDNLLAFTNPNGETIIFIANKENAPRDLKIKLNNKIISLTVKAKSFNTLSVK